MANHVQARQGVRPVADDIAKTQHILDAAAVDLGEDGRQGFEVAVNVTDDRKHEVAASDKPGDPGLPERPRRSPANLAAVADRRPDDKTDRPPIRVALLGHGTVGKSVVELLSRPLGELRRRTGMRFDLVAVAVRDKSTAPRRRAGLRLTEDADAAATHPEADVVIELMGGVDRAKTLVLAALAAGKVGRHRKQGARGGSRQGTFRRGPGRRRRRRLRSLLRRGHPDRRLHLQRPGVRRSPGTCRHPQRHKQRDPVVDDVARQNLSRGSRPTLKPPVLPRPTRRSMSTAVMPPRSCRFWRGWLLEKPSTAGAVHREGIDTLDPRDVAFAGKLGYVIKLLAVARRDERDRLALSVFPGLLPASDPLSDVNGPFNAVAVYGRALGRSLLVGRGAGGMPTAAAVVSDLVSVASGASQANVRSRYVSIPISRVLPTYSTSG